MERRTERATASHIAPSTATIPAKTAGETNNNPPTAIHPAAVSAWAVLPRPPSMMGFTRSRAA